MEIRKVGVVGAGLMGAGIAQVAAQNGLDVTLVELDGRRLALAIAGIRGRLDREAERRQLTGAEADAILNRISPSSDCEEFAALKDADAIIEAVAEDLQVKSEVFRRLGTACKPGALLSSNTSSLPLSDLAAASGRADRVIGLHFFNPPWALKLVEVVTTASTSDETRQDGLALCEKLGRITVQVRDTPGFIANRLLVPLIFDAIQLLDSGVASAEDIDNATKLGLSHTMGPIATADLIGLDTLQFIAQSMFEEYGEARFKAPILLRRLVSLGHLGRKTGRGFYRYDHDAGGVL